MSDKRDLIRTKILRIQDECYRRAISEEEDCTGCPFDLECNLLLSFNSWRNMLNLCKEGDEVMTVDDYELLELQEVKIE